MFALLGSNLRLIGIGAAVIAIASLAFVVNGWREDSKSLAVERSAYQQAITGFEEQLRQIQEQEQIARDTSREYQAKLYSAQAAADRLRADNRGLQVIAYRRLQPVTISTTRFIDPTPEPERDSGTVVDLERLARLAESCQADAEQLSALQSWALKIASPLP